MKPWQKAMALVLTVMVSLGGAGCFEEEGVKPAEQGAIAPAGTGKAMIDPDSPIAAMACKINRATVQKVIAAYFAQHRVMPTDVGELEARGVFDKRLLCPGGGTYTFDDHGRVNCSVHGQ